MSRGFPAGQERRLPAPVPSRGRATMGESTQINPPNGHAVPASTATLGANSHLGSFIRECRKGLKYTSRQVARLSGERKDLPSISNSYLISVENGKHIPRLDKVIALAD